MEPEGSNFPGGSNFFQGGGGGPIAYSHITCDFPGGGPDLWNHMKYQALFMVVSNQESKEKTEPTIING